MEKNRINLKELSEILNNEVKNGNGDAYLFIGEYYLTNKKWEESYIEDDKIKLRTLETSYSIYTDEVIKEKVMALSYLHVQKLTDAENLELAKLKEGNKSKSNKKKSSSTRLGDIMRDYNFDINDITWDNGNVAPRVTENIRQAPPVNEQANEERAQQETLAGMFDYISYLKETIAPHNAAIILNRLDILENNLCIDNLTASTIEVETIAEEIYNILHIATQARIETEREATRLANMVQRDRADRGRGWTTNTINTVINVIPNVTPVTIDENNREVRANVVNNPPNEDYFDTGLWMF